MEKVVAPLIPALGWIFFYILVATGVGIAEYFSFSFVVNHQGRSEVFAVSILFFQIATLLAMFFVLAFVPNICPAERGAIGSAITGGVVGLLVCYFRKVR